MRIITIIAASVTMSARLASAQSSESPVPPPTPAASTSASWQFGIAPRLGATVPTSKLGPTVIGGLELAYLLGVADHRLFIAADVSVARPGYDSSVMDPRIPNGSTTYTIHETELVVGATVGYRLFTAEHSLVPWGAIGPVLHLLRTSETTMLSPGDNTATSTEVGVEIAGGADFRAGPGYLLGGVRVVYSKLDHQLTGDTNAGKVAIEVGYRFVF